MISAPVVVGLGAVVGATARYAIGELIDGSGFALPTLLVNVVGSFLLGLAVFGGLDGPVALFFAVGLCGSLTTYSSFAVDTVELSTVDSRRGAAYVVATSLCSLLAVAVAAGLVSVV